MKSYSAARALVQLLKKTWSRVKLPSLYFSTSCTGKVRTSLGKTTLTSSKMPEMNVSSSHLPLNQYSKDIPPGWDPRDPNFPLRAYISRLKLWSRTTSLRPEQMGPAVAGRLQGRPFDLALQMQIDLATRPDLWGHYNGRQRLTGDEALAFPGAEEDAQNALPRIASGLATFVQQLEALYGAQDQRINTAAIDAFENLYRHNSMTLLEYVNEFAFLYQQAHSLAGYEINAVARSHRFIRGARQSPELVKNILLLVQQDLARFQDIYNHFTLVAKQQVDPHLPGSAPGARQAYYHDEGDGYYQDDPSWYEDYDGYQDWYGDEYDYAYDDEVPDTPFQQDGTTYYQLGDDEYADDPGDGYYQDYGGYDSDPWMNWYADDESLDVYYGKGKSRGKGRRPKGKGKRPAGKGKYRRPAGKGKFTLYGKGKDGKNKGKGFGRSSGMIGCSLCGSPNHNANECPTRATKGKGGRGKDAHFADQAATGLPPIDTNPPTNVGGTSGTLFQSIMKDYPSVSHALTPRTNPPADTGGMRLS